MADNGFDVIALKDMRNALIFIHAVLVNQGAGLFPGGGNDLGDQRFELGKVAGFDCKRE